MLTAMNTQSIKTRAEKMVRQYGQAEAERRAYVSTAAYHAELLAALREIAGW